MAILLPPPPINDKPGSFTWLEWYRQLRAYVTTTGNVPWYIIDFSGSNLNDIAIRNHNQLQSLQGGTTNEYYHLTNLDYTNLTSGSPSFTNVYTDYLVFNKASGYGIKVDKTTPTYPWEDLKGEITIRGSGAADPSWVTWNGSIKQYRFSNAVTNEVTNAYHIDHDYAPGTNMYIHVHWSQITLDTGGPAGVPGDAKWYFEVSYAKGHQQAAFSTPITTSVVQQGSTTLLTHNIAEVQLSTSGGSSSMLNTDNLEPDGVILIRTYRNPADAADTLDKEPFVHYVDIHYQSTGIGTKQKAPNFYT